MLHQGLFLYFAAVMVVSAVLMITRRNPVHSVLFMLLLFFHIAGVFVMLNAEFIAAVQLIVYAGAILILYLFVVMLLNVDRESSAPRANRFWPWVSLFGLMIMAEISLLLYGGRFPAAEQKVFNAELGTVRSLGTELYTRYLLPFEAASLVLLVGLVGAIMLAKKKVKE